jgi:hypothetical protein
LRTGKVEKGKAPLPVSGKPGRGPESGKEADESASFPVLCGKCSRMMVIYRSAVHCERERIPGDGAVFNGPGRGKDVGSTEEWQLSSSLWPLASERGHTAQKLRRAHIKCGRRSPSPAECLQAPAAGQLRRRFAIPVFLRIQHIDH